MGCYIERLLNFRRNILPPSSGSGSLLGLFDPGGGNIMTTVIVSNPVVLPGTLIYISSKYIPLIKHLVIFKQK